MKSQIHVRQTHNARAADSAWLTQRSRIYWYDQYALNEQETAFRAYDPDRIAEELAGTGADIIALYATNQFGVAYYPSAIWPQHPNLQGRDYLGDLTERLRARGKKIIHYINWLDSKHLDWRVVPPDQTTPLPDYPLASWAAPDQPNYRVHRIPGGQWQFPCINSPQRSQVVAVAQEIIKRYRPDGFHLDMLIHPSLCICSYCRPILERICGTQNLTAEVIYAHWPKYIDWFNERRALILNEISALLRKNGVIAVHNTFAPLFCSAQSCAGSEALPTVDVFLSECFDAMGLLGTDLNSTSINCRWQRATGKAGWVLLTSSRPYYAHWPLTEAKWQVYAAACKANAAKVFGPCGVGAYPDTTSARNMLDRVKTGLNFFMEDADLDDGAESLAKIALGFSWATRKYALPEVSGDLWSMEFNGWARLMIEEHLPFDVVILDDLDGPEKLQRYDMLVLPDTTCMSNRCCQAIRSYVRNGGRLLATGESSRLAETGRITRSNFGLGDVLGVEWCDVMTGPFAIESAADPEPACGRLQRVHASGACLAHLVSVDEAGGVAGNEDPLPVALTPWPIFTEHLFGEGRSIYVAFDIGRHYAVRGPVHIGEWMTRLIDRLFGARQIAVKAPRTVEVTLWRQPNRVVIHLANRSVPWTLPTAAREIREILPVHDVDLTLPLPWRRPAVTGRHCEPKHRMKGSALHIRVPLLNAYAAVIIGHSNNSTPRNTVR